jgi:hypothetical protein
MGRNELLRLGFRQEKLRGKEYDYFIFADDDVDLVSRANVANPVDEFHRFLDTAQPAIGVPRYRHLEWEKDAVVSVCHFDAILNAFHRDTLPILFPLTERFDSVSWWMSQMVLERRACSIYAGNILRMPSVMVANSAHRDYQRGMIKVSKFFVCPPTCMFETLHPPKPIV